MHDANGTRLMVGDKVMIPCEITALHETEGEGFCNVKVQTLLGRRPDGAKESFSSINTNQLVKLSGEVEIGF